MLRTLDRNLRTCTFWYVHPTKTQISLYCPHDETLHHWLSKMPAVMILIWLCEYTCWSESTLGKNDQRYVFWRCGSNGYKKRFYIWHSPVSNIPSDKTDILTRVLLNTDMRCLCKQCRSRSVSQLIWIYTVCNAVFEFISTTWIK